MLALEATFLTGRYHANPWDRHPNEGAHEWPPSPWRLLRALVSSWKRTAPDIEGSMVGQLLSLMSEAPSFGLPAAGFGHLRSYVPTARGSRLLLDAFTVLGGPVVFVWQGVTLNEQQRSALQRLLDGVGYLGRAESWVDLRYAPLPMEVDAEPLVGEGESAGDLVRLLCADQGLTVEHLLTTVADLRKLGINRPPGSRWVAYHLRRRRPVAVAKEAKELSLVTYLLRCPVPRTETLVLADRVRRQLLASQGWTSTLGGKEGEEPRKDGHRHLHVLPMGESREGPLTWITLWAPEGFSSADQLLLRELRVLPRWGGQRALELLIWDFAQESDRETLFGRGQSWISDTPYLMARHPKGDGRDSAEEQIRRDCLLRGLPQPEISEAGVVDGEYRLRRRQRPAPPGPARAFRLHFPQAVLGPLCLGASSHFGMGRFVLADL